MRSGDGFLALISEASIEERLHVSELHRPELKMGACGWRCQVVVTTQVIDLSKDARKIGALGLANAPPHA